jgi:3-oxoacyl-[acyl-carrier-protein] synthase-1
LISPLGFSLNENFKSILGGKSGLKLDNRRFIEKSTYTSIFNDRDIDKWFLKYANPTHFTKLEKLSIGLIHDIIEKTNIDPKSDKTLLILSTTKGNIDTKNSKISQERVLLSEFKAIIQKHFSFKNSPLILSNACISGIQALILADDFIKDKSYENVIVIGADLVSRFTMTGFSALNALSSEKCMPFDKSRTGLNLGECCAGIVVSSKNNKKNGNARILSNASTSDAHHTVAPSREGEGLTNAIKKCLKNHIDIPIDFISAHGTATIYNDEMEALSVCNNDLGHSPIFSLKAYYGHTLGAAGLLEIVISLKALDENTLIPSLGFTSLGVSNNINIITKTQKKEVNTFLKIASGFGGVNAAILIQKT